MAGGVNSAVPTPETNSSLPFAFGPLSLASARNSAASTPALSVRRPPDEASLRPYGPPAVLPSCEEPVASEDPPKRRRLFESIGQANLLSEQQAVAVSNASGCHLWDVREETPEFDQNLDPSRFMSGRQAPAGDPGIALSAAVASGRAGALQEQRPSGPIPDPMLLVPLPRQPSVLDQNIPSHSVTWDVDMADVGLIPGGHKDRRVGRSLPAEGPSGIVLNPPIPAAAAASKQPANDAGGGSILSSNLRPEMSASPLSPLRDTPLSSAFKGFSPR